jgi:putative oxidoreductase
MKLARFLLRVLVGALFVGHGTQKLFGWFGGYGLDATAQAFEGMGMRPGRRHAVAGGAAEAAGGTALALGFATPLAAASLVSVMLTAINRVHLKNGVWVTNGGYEYNAVLIAAALAVAEAGPGPLSLDAALGTETSGAGAALTALGLGVAGAVGVHLAAEAAAPEPAPAPVPAQPAADTANGAAEPTPQPASTSA